MGGRAQKREPGLQKRAVLYFTAFVLFILCLIYLFQIVLLGTFYKSVKQKEINYVMNSVKKVAGTLSETETAESLSERYRICMILCSIDGEELTLEFEKHSLPGCIIHDMREKDKTLRLLYDKAVESGGTYKRALARAGGFGDAGDRDSESTMKSIIMTSVFTGADGVNYVLFLEAQLTPVNSSVNTLKSQFSWLTVVILVSAAAAGYVFAWNISKPLSRINDTAKKMAAGDLSVHFPVEGYRETKELAGTLNYAVSEISRSDKLQRELIANVSHDLRTPLTMISGYAEIMKDIPGENTAENLQVIIDEARHLTELVNDMLDLSRIEAGVKKPDFTDFDISSTVREVLNRYSALMTHDGYDISFEAPEGEIIVHADRTMILQVIYNLVNNAINYTGEDKKVYVLEQERVNAEGKRTVRITVRDTGEGIEPEHLNDIWDRYYKVGKDHKRAAKGTGIGLSIVKHVLQAHSADFGVESSKTQGSSFWFELEIKS